MTSIVSYQKVFTPHTTIQMQMPDSIDGINGDSHCTELCTLDGLTYVSVPDGVVLPPQPSELTVAAVVLTDALRDQIKAASPHVQLINRRVAEKIAERYSLVDEIRLLRTLPSADFDAYNAHVEVCRAQGRAEKALLGLAGGVEVPMAVTMRQARVALLQAGLLSSINTTIAAMSGPDGDAARVTWEFSSEVRRDNPLIAQMAVSMSLTSDQIDQLFIAAAAL